ncbi:hypothetical protein QYE76_032304 [Lolium multiflorum]|uniref:Uncharacterized protein n=1 Tax=Lolium multiflorum TaxID=4521 RepID=A0AAD8VKG2_LOLMU|nr:hypothetical protein QYE76_032304 [Lolium multiflorum]
MSNEELRDEVRCLTRFSQKDNIILTSARPPYDFKHLPAEASTVAQCYPPTPESGVEPEDDDDDSEGTEDAQHVLEDSDVHGDEAPVDDAFTKDRRCRRINEDLITTAESSPSGQDNDANETASPPPAAKSSTGFFAVEDDLDLSDDDDEVPLAKRVKLFSEKAESAKESNPLTADPTPPSRTGVVKIPVSKVIPSASTPIPPATRDHPIYAIVDAVADFADQFTRLESENAHLRKTIKTSADQVLEANKLTADAQNENILLKDELKKLKKKMKDEQDARREAAIAADEKEGILRESITNLLNAVDMTINRARKLRENSMSDALSLATESNIQGPIFARSFQKTEEITKWGHEAARRVAGAAQALATPTYPRALVWPLALTLRLLKASAKPPAPRATIRKTFETPPPNPISGIQEIASGTLPERGFISRRTLHRHGRLRSDE